jgi:hypothetical protein
MLSGSKSHHPHHYRAQWVECIQTIFVIPTATAVIKTVYGGHWTDGVGNQGSMIFECKFRSKSAALEGLTLEHTRDGTFMEI